MTFPHSAKEVIQSGLVRRTFDPAFLNSVANHPEVRPWLQGEGDLDITHQAFNPANFVLQSEFGGFVLLRHEPGRYEVHSQFLPGHGTHPAKAMLAAQEWMFTRTDCVAIVSKVPAGNKRAKGFAMIGGLRTIFERDDAVLGPCEYVELTIADWAMRTPTLESHGHRFHDFTRNLGWADHPVDPAHERAVGGALLMVERGQVAKGVAFYNRWARLAGYPESTLVSESPPVIDMSVGGEICVLGMGESGMEALLCRSASQ